MNEIAFVTAVLITLLLIATGWNRWRRHKLLATIKVVTLPDFPSSHLQNKRDVLVFLPPRYAAANKNFPVLYLNDGQDVGQLKLQETLAQLIARGKITQIIVVAIPANDERLHEYGTAVAANAQGLGRKAAQYSQFVITELMPHINREFRTRTEAWDTAVLGASLGGLSAFDMTWNHPEMFGTAGVFSGSFWWRAGEEEQLLPSGQPIAHQMVRQGTYRPHQRFWFEAATQDETADRDNNGVIDAIQDTMELIEELEKLGYRRGENVVYVEILGGRHNYDTWAEVLPHFLTWAFPG